VIGGDDPQFLDIGMHNTEMIESDILAHHVECVRESIWLEDGGLKSGCCVSLALQNGAAFIARGQSGKACLNRAPPFAAGSSSQSGVATRNSFLHAQASVRSLT
jgi:hypothetical protein